MIVDPLRKDAVFAVLRVSGPLIRLFLAVELVKWVDGPWAAVSFGGVMSAFTHSLKLKERQIGFAPRNLSIK